VKERPILFSAPMVRALLAGTKTQTRRVIKPAPQMVTDKAIKPWDGDAAALQRLLEQTGKSCPYGQPGDRLWVREAHSLVRAENPEQCPAWYWADGNPVEGDWTKPRPSIHMHRWASRILLEISSVRVERLQAISEADALTEGVESWAAGAMSPDGQRHYSAYGKFEVLWSSINGISSWHADPWVWVVEFSRLPATFPCAA
jgi:hypothetical protein